MARPRLVSERDGIRLRLAPAVRTGAVALAVIVTAAAAQVSVPRLPPVLLVLTPLAVLVSAAALGARLGRWPRWRLIAGIVGLPVFAPSIQLPPGALRLIGPTGGYFVACIRQRRSSPATSRNADGSPVLTSLAAMLAGLAIIFAGASHGSPSA
jgi:biotin transporter BioY